MKASTLKVGAPGSVSEKQGVRNAQLGGGGGGALAIGGGAGIKSKEFMGAYFKSYIYSSASVCVSANDDNCVSAARRHDQGSCRQKLPHVYLMQVVVESDCITTEADALCSEQALPLRSGPKPATAQMRDQPIDA